MFADTQILTKQFKAVFTLSCNIYDSITIIVALDSIYKNFDTKTLSLLEIGEKTIDEI